MAFLTLLALAIRFLVLTSTGTSAAAPRPATSRGLKARKEFDYESSLLLGPQAVNVWKREEAKEANNDEDASPKPLESDISRYWFEQPLDHLAEGDEHKWKQAYWVSTKYYKPGTNTPVILFDCGWGSCAARQTILRQGIINHLTKSVGGIGILLEHRYYGSSVPVQNFTTDSLRWLNNAQATSDSANFMKNVKIPGVDEDITAPKNAWIYYGASSAGARAAHMRILYPDLVYGAITSSGTTRAVVPFWQGYDAVRRVGEPRCVNNIEKTIEYIDDILSSPTIPRDRAQTLKRQFGLETLYDDDFAITLSKPLQAFAARHWDPQVNVPVFDDFCLALETPRGSIGKEAFDLPYGHADRSVDLGEGFIVDVVFVNYAEGIIELVAGICGDLDVLECLGTHAEDSFTSTDLGQTWRPTYFQRCHEWGGFDISPPDPEHPRIISKLVTLEFLTKICRLAYEPGQHFALPPTPNVTAVNAFGGFDIAADRLAIIDGELDVFRTVSPHSDDARPRNDTIRRPFKLIPGGGHRWDMNGLPDINDEPPEISKIHTEMIEFVKEWLKDWKKKDS